MTKLKLSVNILILIIMVCVTFIEARADINNGLVGWWKLDDNSGTTATDSATAFSGATNNGTLTNGPTWVTGHNGYAVSFDGSNDYIDLGTPSALNITSNAITVSAWVKPNSFTNYSGVAGNNDSVNAGYLLYSQSTGIVFGLHNNSSFVTTSCLNSNVSDWQLWTGVYDGSYLYIYLNGALCNTPSSVTGNIKSSSVSFKIGDSGYTAVSHYWNGYIDNVRIYNRALSAGEVRDLYTRESLVAHWKMDEGAGTASTADSSTSGYTGTLQGSPSWINGRSSYGLSFDGSSQYFTAGDVLDFTGTSPYSIAMWFNLPSIPGAGTYNRFISKESWTGGRQGWDIVLNGDTGKLGCERWLNGAGASGVFTPSVNVWTHVVCTYDGSIIKLYKNGVQVASGSSSHSLSNHANNLAVAAFSTGISNRLAVSLDDIRIYDQALTAAEVRKLFNSNIRATANDGF